MAALSARADRLASPAAIDAPAPPRVPRLTHPLRRRLIGLGLAAITVGSLLLAVPGLRDALDDIGKMHPGWIGAAIALEIASCVAFVVVFRALFGTVPGHLARRVAWTEVGSGALLPGGGFTSYALGGVLLHRAGLDRRRIVILSGGLFWLTTAVNAAALVLGAVLLATGASAGPRDFAHAGAPLLGTLAATALILAAAHAARKAQRGWLVELGEGVRAAFAVARAHSWRIVGAAGYLGLDIAVLWCTFHALGYAPSAGTLFLGYLIGYLATIVPIPGGIGVLEGGLAGALILYGTPATTTVAAVLVYHAIAFWVPSLGGLFAYVQLRGLLARDEP